MAIPQRPISLASSPASLPEIFPSGNGVVRQHNHLTFSHQKLISVLSKRIMARVLEQIPFGATLLLPAYKVGVLDLVRGTNLNADDVYKYAKSSVDELADVRWNFEDLEEKCYVPRHLLDTTLPKAQASRAENGLITIVLNPALAPYFLNLAGHYTTFSLDGYLQLNSWYAMRLFEMLASWESTGVWYTSIEDYRGLMDCAPELDKLHKPKKDKAGKLIMKYPVTKDLIAQTIPLAQRELASTPYAFSFVACTEVKAGRGRRKITHLEFRLLRPRLKAIPEQWLADAKSRALIEGLRRFQISESNIIDYWDILQPAGFRQLLREWQLKEISQERINSKVSYCNAALVRAGKKVLDHRRQLAAEPKGKGQQQLFPSSSLPLWLTGE